MEPLSQSVLRDIHKQPQNNNPKPPNYEEGIRKFCELWDLQKK